MRAAGIGVAVAGVVLALVFPSTAWSRPAGRLVGTVVDEAGGPVAGAEVTVIAEGHAEPRRGLTAGDGTFRMEGLAPGRYRVEARTERGEARPEAVRIEPDRTQRVRLVIDGGPPVDVPEVPVPEVGVIADVPAVDQGTATGLVLDGEARRALPWPREIEAVVERAAGAGSDGRGPTLRGASSPEILWRVDGLDTTDVGVGLSTSTLPPEFVDVLSVRTGGYGADLGGAGGGVVDVVTRSGGQAHRGEIFLHHVPGALTASRITEADAGAILRAEARPVHATDLGLALGGPLVPGRAWYFVGVSPVSSRTAHRRDVLSRDGVVVDGASRRLDEDRFRLASLARLDVQLDERQAVGVTWFGNPSRMAGVVDPNLRGDEAGILGEVREGAANLVATWRGRFQGDRLRLTSRVGLHDRVQSRRPAAGVADDHVGTRREYPHLPAELAALPGCEPVDPADPATSPCAVRDWVSGPFWLQEDNRLSRLSAAASAGRLLSPASGVHLVSAGGEIHLDRFLYRRGAHGGSILRDFGPDAPVRYQRAALGDLDEAGDFVPDPLLATDARGAATALWVQDRFEPVPGLTLEGGLRWETQHLFHPDGSTALAIRDNLAPRVGAAWDFTGEGRSRVFAHFGRYHQRVPLNVVVRSFGGGVTAAQLLAEDGTNLTPSVAGEEWILVGADPPWVQPGLKGPYHDEILAGVEYGLGPAVVVGATLVHRALGRAVEDVALDDGARRFAIANPGDPRVPDAAASATEDDLANLMALGAFPRPVRTYEALELTARTAPAARWVLVGSLTLSRLRGNYPGYYAPENDQLDPNVTSQFDLPDLLLNRLGRLRQDRPVQIKVDVFRHFDPGVVIGASLRYASGRPIDVLGSHALYGRREVFVLPRGAGGRTPPLWEADVSLGWAMPIADGLNAYLGVVVHNVFDLRRPVNVDDAWTHDVVRPVTGGRFEDIEDEAGEPRLRTVDGAIATRNPGWGEPRGPFDLQAPRQVRLTARVDF